MPRLIRLIKIQEMEEDKEKEITHYECGAVIGYFNNEIQYWFPSDYYIVCPNCNQIIVVK